jgi:peptide/nickel transport system permease protein
VSVLTPSLSNLMVAVGLAAVPSYARLVRGSVLSAKENLYVEAARAVGCPDALVLGRYILPNVVAPIIVTATLGMGRRSCRRPRCPSWGSGASRRSRGGAGC